MTLLMYLFCCDVLQMCTSVSTLGMLMPNKKLQEDKISGPSHKHGSSVNKILPRYAYLMKCCMVVVVYGSTLI